MPYNIVSGNVVLGETGKYSFLTGNTGSLQIQSTDPLITESNIDVHGIVTCDTVALKDPVRQRVISSDVDGRLIETSVPLSEFELHGSRLTGVEADTSNIGNLISSVDDTTFIYGNGITANSSMNVYGGNTGSVLKIHSNGDTIVNVFDSGQTVFAADTNLNGITSPPFDETLSIYGNTKTTGFFIGNVDASNVYATLVQAPNAVLQGIQGAAITLTGNLYAGNGNFSGDVLIAASDQRLKSDIVRISSALETVKDVHGYTFTWDDTCPGLPLSGNSLGVLAQEVQNMPGIGNLLVDLAPFDRNLDDTSVSGNSYLTVKYEKLIAILLECVHELNERLSSVETILANK